MQREEFLQNFKDKLTIVIPTLNEEEAIGKVLDELFQLGYKKEQIIIVDGYSKDKTVEIAKEKGVKIIYQDGKGKADAIKTAVEHINTEYMLVMDGDYTYDPKYIEKMLKYINDYDQIIGARTINRNNISIINRFGNWVITKAFNILFGIRLKDVCSGMYLIKTDIAKEIKYESSGFSLEVEIAAHTASMTGKIKDIDINYRKRIGRQKLSRTHGIKILFDAVLLAWKYNPAFFIFGIASLLIIPAAIIAGWVAYEYIFLGIKHYIWAVAALSIGSIGVTAALLAIMTIYLKRLEKRIIEKIEKRVKKD